MRIKINKARKELMFCLERKNVFKFEFMMVIPFYQSINHVYLNHYKVSSANNNLYNYAFIKKTPFIHKREVL